MTGFISNVTFATCFRCGGHQELRWWRMSQAYTCVECYLDIRQFLSED